MNPDPIQYPKVEIGGDVIEVKFRCGDIIRLEKAGIDIGDMQQLTGVPAMKRTLALLSAGISHTIQKTADELADLIDLAYLPTVGLAINEAFLKVSAQTTQPASKPTQVQ